MNREQDGSTVKWDQKSFTLSQIKITGQSWVSFIEEQILKPAGMDDTYFLWNLPSNLKNQSTIYEVNYDAENYSIAQYDIINEHDYYIPTATGIFTNSSNLAKFAMALQSDKFLNKKTRQEMWTSSGMAFGRR